MTHRQRRYVLCATHLRTDMEGATGAEHGDHVAQKFAWVGIGVGAQSSLGGKTFLPENICMKN